MARALAFRVPFAAVLAAYLAVCHPPFLQAGEYEASAAPSRVDAERLAPSENAGSDESRANTFPVGTADTLPRNLSPLGMFSSADWVVKTVMIGLILASLLTWTVWLAKTVELLSVKRLATRNLTALKSARSFDDAANHESVSGIGKELITIAQSELQHSSGISDKSGVTERVATSLSRLEAAYARRMIIGTGLLATIGAVAPFVGLFGTVWGIMNSFIGISKAQTTNLAVVAPGLAEALLATALGLFAAIPAVIIYNYFARQIAGAKALISDMTAEILNFVSRDLDRESDRNLDQ